MSRKAIGPHALLHVVAVDPLHTTCRSTALPEAAARTLDLRLAKRFRLGSTDLELAGVLQQRLDDEALTWRENLYDDRRQVYFSAQVAF